MSLLGEDDYRAWVFTLASAMACVGGAALIFIDIVLKRICQRDVRILQNHRILAGSLGLGSGVMIYSSFYNILPEAKEQLSHELSFFADHADAFVMLFFFSGVGAMLFVHWIMHRFNSSSSPGIEHSESMQYFMPPEDQSSHQRLPSHQRYSTPFHHQHAQYAPQPYYAKGNGGKHHDDRHGYHDHDAESHDQDSEYVDDEVTSLLNNAFLQIGATPATQIEEAMDRRRKKELQRQQRRGRQGSSELEHGDREDHDHSNHSEDSSEDGPGSIEVVIEDPRKMLDLKATATTNHTTPTIQHHHKALQNGHAQPLPSDSASSSWSSILTDSPEPTAPVHPKPKKGTTPSGAANGRSKSRKRFRDSGHFHHTPHKPSSTVTTGTGADAGHRRAAPSSSPPPPPSATVHHTYQTFAPPSTVGGKNNGQGTAKSSQGLPHYPYSNHSKSASEATPGTLRRTSFPHLQHTSPSPPRHQDHHHPHMSLKGSRHSQQHSQQQQQQQQQPAEQRPLLNQLTRRGSDPLTTSRHDILDHAATDDHEHMELADIGLQTAFTIAVHKFPEGLITFLSTTADPCLGFSVFMALAVHNIIEGYLIAFPLFIGLRSRTKAFAYAAALGGLSQPIGALLGWFILRKVVSLGWQVSAAGVIYALVAGMMASIAVNGMWPQAVKCAGRQPTKVVPISFFAGIAIMGVCQAVMGSKCKT